MAIAGAQTDRGALNVGHLMNVTVVAAPIPIDATGTTLPPMPSTAPFRVRVRLRSSGTGRWTIAVTSGTRRIETIGPDDFVENEYWTDEIESGSATLRLEDGDARVQVEIDAYAIQTEPAQQQGIVDGVDESVEIGAANAPSKAKMNARPIARVKLMAKDNGPSCSGFLLGRDLLMTNQHCVSTEAVRNTALIEFGADSAAAVTTTFRVKKIEVLNRQLDYSLLRLSANASQFGRLYIGSSAVMGMPLLLIQHPVGKVKKVAFPTHCGVRAERANGVDNRPVDFGHSCDTLGGSSGSPVLGWNDTLVVGLHHWTYLTNSPGSFNQAVRIEPIVEDLELQVRQGKLPRAVVDEVEAKRPQS